MGGCRRSSKRPFSPSLSPGEPVPISAEYIPGDDQIAIDFSENVSSLDDDASLWTARIGGFDRGVDNIADVSGVRVLLQLSGSVADPGPNVVSYAPPPFDIVSFPGGTPAPAFANFPVA